MRFFSLAGLLALPLALTVAQEDAGGPDEAVPYTLEEVELQIDEYLDHINATDPTSADEDPDVAARSLPSGCSLACGFLNFARPNDLFYPNDPEYQYLESRYWSQQQAGVEPECRFTPRSAAHVSLAVLTARVVKCEFAVKSGGHAAFAGASSAQDGLTIDLIHLTNIEVSSNKKKTTVGAGNVWYDVYSDLTPQGLTVVGGRVSAIGVGGLTLGGGLSFVSNRHGWACDNVDAYEVVFADGSIRKVTKNAYSDLYWALRGGGNNFGIVTSFDLATYAQGDFWAGVQTFFYTDETSAAINDAFYHLGLRSSEDPYAQVIMAYAYAQVIDSFVIASDLQYSKPVVNPPILQNFTSIPGAIADTMRITDLPGLTVEFNDTNPGGFRQSYWTLTVGNDADLMGEMVAIYKDEVEGIKDAPGIVPSAVFQLITEDMITHMSKNGGNPLGLQSQQGPLNLLNIAISWSNAADDARILAAAQRMVDRSRAAAQARGLDHPFLYQNYASQFQDVFASYGSANLARLRQISKKYDPTKVWQKLQKGYFKLG
ncbi:Bifunctional solanapyrone synthase-like protein [Hapsidospora chrysogenum ATCC 11550]|uniref:Bifunctional solanapyrone synthase-like protein n=1 Tax=Hapsidospora chrysogenum (strain ATCC 11550 / CBS 779.69 / DSM 880 / IAM 14645 / JCM 23072 / IMI 49137) TaxID=857340 RepID=A0A086TG34_HAPC1|nr:Bifunctional solanapyrone synthase-like protein [Hapsidospora chrysogenum ATCC 11550]